MKVFIDADACPVITQTEEICQTFNIPCELVCDHNHHLTSDYSSIVVLDQNANSADLYIANHCHENDIVVTNDLGLSTLILAKKGFVINSYGAYITNHNIDSMLFSRHLHSKNIRRKKYGKGPRKRTEEDDKTFYQSFQALVQKIKKNGDDK